MTENNTLNRFKGSFEIPSDWVAFNPHTTLLEVGDSIISCHEGVRRDDVIGAVTFEDEVVKYWSTSNYVIPMDCIIAYQLKK